MLPLPELVVLHWIARGTLGTTFVLSGLAKLRDLPSFVGGALVYDLGSPDIVRPLARLLPFVEVALGLQLLADGGTALAAGGALVLLSVFGVAVGVNLRRGRHIPCFCLGASCNDEIGPATLMLIGLLAVVAWLALAGAPGRPSPVGGEVVAEISIMWQLSLVLSLFILIELLAPIEHAGREFAAAIRSRRMNGA